jgi:hypothetical protein
MKVTDVSEELLPPPSWQEMEAARSSEMLVPFYSITLHHIPGKNKSS